MLTETLGGGLLGEQMPILLAVGALLLAGYLGGRLASFVRLPRVTGYIVAGMLLGPVSGLVPGKIIRDELGIIVDVALGIVAFSIGGSLKVSKLRRLAKHIIPINLFEASGAFVLSTLAVVLLGPWLIEVPGPASFWQTLLPVALIIGAVGAATAPAAVLAVVHESGAKGPLTTTLLGIVALDDAMAIIFFAFVSAVVAGLTGAKGLSAWATVAWPLAQIALSVVLGALGGLLLRVVAATVGRREALFMVVLGFILSLSGLAAGLGLSPLMANMALGFVAVNWIDHGQALFDILDLVEDTVFGLFFAVAGGHIEFGLIETAGLLAAIILLARFAGKLLGTRLGAWLSGAPIEVKRYLGLGLLPQAGVTMGLILVAKNLLVASPLAEVMVNAVLGSVILNELVAPPILRLALIRSGEATKVKPGAGE